MRRFLVAACLALLQSCGSSEPTVVNGVLTFNTFGRAFVAECGTGRKFTLGVMASNPYFILSRKYDEISARGTKPVLAHVRGVLATSSNSGGELILEYPQVTSMTNGTCDA